MPGLRDMQMHRAMRVAAAAVAVLGALGSALAFPRPAAVPTRWELEFQPGPLRVYLDEPGGEVFWYMPYMVTNRTGRERIWAPTFALYTDAGEIIASGRDVPSRVTEDLLELLGNELMKQQNEIIGEIFHGRENAREGLVVWRAGDVDVNELSVFVAGISGETTTIRNPASGERVTLRKTLKRDYLIPGEAIARGSKPVELVVESWVMR